MSIVWHNINGYVTLVRTKRTIPPELRIIKAFVKNEELEQYRLPKETGLSYRTILRTLKLMENEGLIRQIRTEPSKKGGKEKKIYGLTFKGALSYLESLRPQRNDYLVGDQIFYSLEKINEIIVKNFEQITPGEMAVFLDNLGKQHDFPIFKQINWLEQHYGLDVFRATVFAAGAAMDRDKLPNFNRIEKSMLANGEGAKKTKLTLKDFQFQEFYFLREAFTETFAYQLSLLEGNGDLHNDTLQKVFAALVSKVEQANQGALTPLKQLIQTFK